MSTIEEKKEAMRKRKEAALAAQTGAKPEDAAITRPKPALKPEDAVNKMRIVFDNSGSMGSPVDYNRAGSPSKIKEAKDGVVEYLRNCSPTDAVAIHMLEIPAAYEEDGYYNDNPFSRRQLALPALIQNEIMTTDLVLLASNIKSDLVKEFGGTPLIETINKALDAQPKATRIVAFSDGAATGERNPVEVCNKAKSMGIPVDTVFFGSADDLGAALMKQIAELTGGIFLVFDPAKGVEFSKALKYLTPGRRLMLMNAEFKAKLERGEVK